MESQAVQGRVTIDVLDGKTLALKDRMIVGNKIVTTGLRYLSTLLKGAIQAPTDVAVGTDNTAPVAGDTALVAQVFKDFITQRLNITDGVRIRFFLPTTAANGSSLKEAAILGPSPAVLMLARVIYTAIAKDSSIAINYSWDITFSQP